MTIPSSKTRPSANIKKTHPLRTRIKRIAFFGIAIAIILCAVYYQSLTLPPASSNEQITSTQSSPTKNSSPTQRMGSISPAETIKPRKQLDSLVATGRSALDQSILAVQISYWQLTQNYPKASVIEWLSLAKNQIKRSDINTTEKQSIQIHIENLQNNIKATKTPDWAALLHGLEKLHTQIEQLTQPKYHTVTQAPAPQPQVQAPTDAKTRQAQIYQVIENMVYAVKTSITDSIHVDTISPEAYQTLNNTLGQPVFYHTAHYLIQKAEAALVFHDAWTFQYTMTQLDTLLKTTIVDPQIRTPLEQQVHSLLAANPTSTLPDYTPLLQALNNLNIQDQHPQPAQSKHPTQHLENSSENETRPLLSAPYSNSLQTKEITM